MRVARTGPRIVLALVALAALVPAGVGAQLASFEPYGGGSLSFSYQEWPAGPFAGDFAAQGPAFGNGSDPADFAQAVGGGFGVGEGMAGVVGYAAVRDPGTGLVDLAVLWVGRPGDQPPPPGDHSVDLLGGTVGLAFATGIADFDLPADLETLDVEAWLAGLTRDRLLVASSGVICLTQADASGMAGGFSGTLFEGLTMVAVSQGSFAIGEIVPAVPGSWGGVKSLFR